MWVGNKFKTRGRSKCSSCNQYWDDRYLKMNDFNKLECINCRHEKRNS